MIKKILISCLVAMLVLTGFSQNAYKYSLNLVDVKKDRIKVELTPPKIAEEEAIFVMPMVIPGSYAKKDYGRFIKKVKAFDVDGKKLKVKRQNINDFYISKANTLGKVEYWADDTWDDKNKKQFVFQPGGSNIDADKNFVLNCNALIGYFENYQQNDFELEVYHNANMYGGTPLYVQYVDKETDIILAGGYNELVDNPIMYCEPDTSSFMVSNTQVFVVNYSPNNIVTAKQIADYVKPLGEALTNFFGVLPVDKYYFICYWADPKDEVKQKTAGLGGYGALEHNKSSFYYLPEIKNEQRVKELIQDIGAHEFLHIITPLNIRSEEISFFNFRNPKMSRHLWMYEGITEYFSWLVRVQNELVDEQEFMHEMRMKIFRSKEYGDYSMTEMSRNILTEANQERYSDVYQGGAIVGLMLDIQLQEWSEGKYALKNLMQDLAAKYGPDKPFKDENLIDEIIAMTTEDLRPFFNNHVIGKEPIPLDRYFQKIGYTYKGDIQKTVPYFGNFAFELSDNEDQLFFRQAGQNEFGVGSGTELLEINGQPVMENMEENIEKILYAKEYDEMTIKVIDNGIIQTIKARPVPAPVKEFAVLEALETSNEKQTELYNWLLKGK